MTTAIRKFKGPAKTRVIEYRCVNCGDKFDEDRYDVAMDDHFPEVSIVKCVRCPDCTRRGMPLLGPRVMGRARAVNT